MALAVRKSSAFIARPRGPVLAQARAGCVLVHASRDFKLTKLANSHSVSIDAAPNNGYVAEPSRPGIVPCVLGGLALVGAGTVAWKKLSKPVKALTDRLPWSKASRDLKMVETLNNFHDASLSQNTIQAARARRSKESANVNLKLEEIHLPDNHPWATKRRSSEIDDATAAERLRARRVRPQVTPRGPPGMPASQRSPMAPPQRAPIDSEL